MSFAVLGFVLAFVFIVITFVAVAFLQRRSERSRSHSAWYSDGFGSAYLSSSDGGAAGDSGGCDGGGGGD